MKFNFDEALSFVEHCRSLLNNASTTYYSNPLYVEEYMPLFSKKNKFTKMEKMINDVTTTMGIITDFSVELNRILSASNAPEHKTNEDKVAFIYPQFLNLKSTIEKTATNLDYGMIELEKSYKFDYSWVRTTKVIENMLKNNIEQRKAQHRSSVMAKIGQHQRNKDVVNDFGVFLSNILSSIDFDSIIKSFRPFFDDFMKKATSSNIDETKDDAEKNSIEFEGDK